MADINEPVVFSVEHEALIAATAVDPAFTYREWATDELETLRRAIRDHYRRVQKGICAYCKKEVSLKSAMNCHVEHIVPKSKYKQFIFEPRNLCVICADCNAIKREQEVLCDEPDTLVRGKVRKQYPRSSSAFKVVHPHFDYHDEHILMVGGFYIGRTEKGHFTIGACDLNRKLKTFGWQAEFNEPAMVAAMVKYLNSRDRSVQNDALLEMRVLLDPL